MDPIRLFISLPFQRDGNREDDPDCIRDFKAPELNRYLRALREEIASASEGMEDCEVTELVFGVGCGLLTMCIRSGGGYPEGVSFAILIMNAVTPLINRFTQPKPFGRK